MSTKEQLEKGIEMVMEWLVVYKIKMANLDSEDEFCEQKVLKLASVIADSENRLARLRRELAEL
jgi:hypothetical protein